mmetsp:Transcript_425/g.454  ORF Transcript_425/g.454 Transcript_425/m.454 type:complete len:545 (-) Transcript_425:193-1827(-)
MEEIDNNLVIPDLSTLLSSLAPAESIAYFYLKDTIGLSEQVMWKITNNAGSILGFTVRNLKEKISLLTRMMNLSDEDIRIIISKQPSILHLSANRNVSQKILFLVRYLDLSKQCLREMVIAYPCILCYSISNLQKKLMFFEDTLGFENSLAQCLGANSSETNKKSASSSSPSSRNELRELLVKHPKLLTAAVDNNDPIIQRRTGLMVKFQFLYKEMNIPKEDLKYIIQRNPNILMYNLEENLQSKLISLFIMRLQMDHGHICNVLKSFPNIVDYNLENHLLPITRYFLTELEFSPMEFRTMVIKFPKIYSYSLFKIKHVVGYLRYQLSMDASQVKRVLYQAPQVISLNTDETVVSKVKFLKDAFSLSQSDGNNASIRKVIVGMPTILLCSIENNLKPKAEYFLKEFSEDKFELRQAILTLPTLMGYSLEKRIKPRMKEIVESGIEPIKITVGITMKEENFKIWLENQKLRLENSDNSLPRKRSSRNFDARIKESDEQEKNNGVESNDLPSVTELRQQINIGDEINSLNAAAQNVTGSRIIHWKR